MLYCLKSRKEKSPLSLKCANCGASVTDDSKFCKYCGAKIEEELQRVEVSGTVNQNITHRFAFNTEARIRKIEAKKELEEERARQAVVLEQERRKTLEKQNEENRRDFKRYMILLAIGIGIFLILSLFESKL